MPYGFRETSVLQQQERDVNPQRWERSRLGYVDSGCGLPLTQLRSATLTTMLGRLSPRSRRNLVRVLPFGLIWFVFSQIFLFSDLLAIRHVKVLPEEAIQPDVAIYLVASFAVTTVGLLIGVVELLFLSDRFADKSLKRKLVSKACIHAAILGAAILVTYPVAASMEIGTSVFDVRVWERFAVFLSSATLLSNVVQLLTMLVVSLIYAEISEHIGHGILVNFFTGRYHRPKEETRIF
ncbi:MAG: hypothetical protein AAGI08_14850, partial [Bacteroidota bacterium]